MQNPTDLYVGKRDAVIAEVGGLSYIYEGKYLLAPLGDGNYDCEGAKNLKEMRELVEEFKTRFPGIRICYL